MIKSHLINTQAKEKHLYKKKAGWDKSPVPKSKSALAFLGRLRESVVSRRRYSPRSQVRFFYMKIYDIATKNKTLRYNVVTTQTMKRGILCINIIT